MERKGSCVGGRDRGGWAAQAEEKGTASGVGERVSTQVGGRQLHSEGLSEGRGGGGKKNQRTPT